MFTDVLKDRGAFILQSTMRNMPEGAEPSIGCKFHIIESDVQTGVLLLGPDWVCGTQ
jgi:hypothetical protein